MLYDILSNTLIGAFYRTIRLDFHRIKWRIQNKENSTEMRNIFDTSLVEVGKKTYGGLRVISYGTSNILKIGNFVSIGLDSTFVLSAEHKSDCVSTYPYRVKIAKNVKDEALSKGDIVIDDDVWIGQGSTILSGVHIGQGAVIGAGSLVTKNVPPYSVVGGVPAKIIKYRFKDDIIKFLLLLDYSRLEDEVVKSRIEDLYISIEDMNRDDIEELFKWFPKKVKDE